MATSIVAISGIVTSVTKKPRSNARPPNNSVNGTSHDIKCASGTLVWTSNFSKPAVPRLNFAQPWAINPIPITTLKTQKVH